MRGLFPKVVAGSTLLLLALSYSTVYAQADCSQAQSCDMCVGESMLNLTGCVWRLCPDGNDTGLCVTDDDSYDNSLNCSMTRRSESCSAIETGAEGGAQGDSGGDSDSPLSQAKFDMSSFVGGIILVLCVQAGGFFAMRFLKSKEQSAYDPIEQPVQ